MHKFKFAICNVCEGFGKMDNPAFSNGFTSSEWSDMHYEEKRAYLNGLYDVTCSSCKGSGKVKIPNIAALTFAEKRELAIKRRDARFDAQFARERALEIAMGC